MIAKLAEIIRKPQRGGTCRFKGSSLDLGEMQAADYAKLYNTVSDDQPILTYDFELLPVMPRLVAIWDDYVAKAQQIAFLIRLPFNLTFRAWLETSWVAEAEMELMERTHCTREEVMSATLRPQVEALAHKMGEEFQGLPGGERINLNREHGAAFLAAHEKFNDISGGMEALLMYVVLESYSAFEAFAGDIWIAAVDIDSHLLSETAIGDLVNAERRKVFLGLLRESHFNLREGLGTALKKMRLCKLSEHWKDQGCILVF